MTQDEFNKAPLLDQILYDTTGMLVENHPDIAEAMEAYHQAKLKLLDVLTVSNQLCDCKDFTIKEKMLVCKKCGKEHKSLSA